VSTSNEGADSQFGTPAKCVLEIGGLEITDDILSVNLYQFTDDHHVLQVRVRHLGAVAADRDIGGMEDYQTILGKAASLEIIPQSDIVDSGRKAEFIGLVTEVSFESSVHGINNVVITAHSPTIGMDSQPKTKVNPPGSDCADIIGSILSQHPISQGRIDSVDVASASSSLNLEVDSGVQYRESDYAFVRRLASEHQLFAFYDGKTFNVEKAKPNNEEELVWRRSLLGFSVGLGAAPTGFRAQVWDPAQKALVSGTADRSSIRSALSDISKRSFDGSDEIYKTEGVSIAAKHPDQALIDGALASEVESSAGKMMNCLGKSIVPAVSVVGGASIKGMDEFDGQYWVKSISHIVDDGGKYRNTFTCTPLELAHPTTILERHPFGYFQVGVVTNNEDPENLGRIKVRLSWHGSSEETDFVRMMIPDGGSERGWFMIPEIDDEVLVAYERGNPDAPIVLGCLYNGQDKPPLGTSDCLDGGKVATKILKTRLGNEIRFDDRDGEETITVTQKDGTNSIVLTMDGPKIVVESTGDIVMKAANISLESTSGDITLKSGAALKAEATSDMELKAGTNFKAEGGVNTEIKAGVAFKATGTQTNLESSGVTVIKGSLVQIN